MKHHGLGGDKSSSLVGAKTGLKTRSNSKPFVKNSHKKMGKTTQFVSKIHECCRLVGKVQEKGMMRHKRMWVLSMGMGNGSSLTHAMSCASLCRWQSIIEQFGLEKTFKAHRVQPPRNEQGHLQLEQVAQSRIQPGPWRVLRCWWGDGGAPAPSAA